MKNSKIKNNIFKLRKQRKSYKEIQESLKISKGTVSYWLSGNPESEKIKKNLTFNHVHNKQRIQKWVEYNKNKWESWKEAGRWEAVRDYPEFIKNPLFTAGIMLYWGEGDSKPKNALRITNTDPRMIKIYVKFLRDILFVPTEKIRIALILYPDLDDSKCKGFWTKTTELPKSNFMKSQFISGHHPTKRLEHGICMVVVNNGQLKAKVLKWIEIFANMAIV